MDSVVPSHLQTLTAMGTESGPVTRLFPVHPALGPRLSETLSTGCGLGWEGYRRKGPGGGEVVGGGVISLSSLKRPNHTTPESDVVSHSLRSCILVSPPRPSTVTSLRLPVDPSLGFC